jgi:hypothetical protein
MDASPVLQTHIFGAIYRSLKRVGVVSERLAI